MDLKLTIRRDSVHKFKFVAHQPPDPEVFIKCFFGTDSKGLAQKIIRGEIELPKKPDAKDDVVGNR